MVANSADMDDLDANKPDFKTTLILKRNQQSMEGRQNQVWIERASRGRRQKCFGGVHLVPLPTKHQGRHCFMFNFQLPPLHATRVPEKVCCSRVLRTVSTGSCLICTLAKAILPRSVQAVV